MRRCTPPSYGDRQGSDLPSTWRALIARVMRYPRVDALGGGCASRPEPRERLLAHLSLQTGTADLQLTATPIRDAMHVDFRRAEFMLGPAALVQRPNRKDQRPLRGIESQQPDGRSRSISLKNAAAPARLERAKRMVKRCARSSVRFNWVLRPQLNVDCWFSPQAGAPIPGAGGPCGTNVARRRRF